MHRLGLQSIRAQHCLARFTHFQRARVTVGLRHATRVEIRSSQAVGGLSRHRQRRYSVLPASAAVPAATPPAPNRRTAAPAAAGYAAPGVAAP
jgi:hypothetical protein